MNSHSLQSRREFMRSIGVVTLGSGVTLQLAGNQCDAAITSAVLRPGDVLVARNSKKWQAWGHFRHVALWDGTNIIQGGGGDKWTIALGTGTVLRTSLQSFLSQEAYDTVIAYRLNANSGTNGVKMARFANTVVGKSGYTCVQLIVTSYYFATSESLSWTKPDHVAAWPGFRWVAGL